MVSKGLGPANADSTQVGRFGRFALGVIVRITNHKDITFSVIQNCGLTLP